MKHKQIIKAVDVACECQFRFIFGLWYILHLQLSEKKVRRDEHFCQKKCAVQNWVMIYVRGSKIREKLHDTLNIYNGAFYENFLVVYYFRKIFSS